MSSNSGKDAATSGVRYSYLSEQFSDCDDLWHSLKKFVATGDFTLGAELTRFEESFAQLIGTEYAIGVNSGTDAIKLLLKALGVQAGDEVITSANTFVATVGAINEVGAKPVFVDCDESFCLSVDELDASFTERTKSVVPVHYGGYMADMETLTSWAQKREVSVVEDACQAILAFRGGKTAGTWGAGGAFSLHPLKNVNVWSDGGVITTDSQKLATNLRLLRNHGLVDRDNVKILGYNSRLDTFQAIVGSWLLPKAEDIANKRIANAKIYDQLLGEIPEITIPPRRLSERVVYHLYMVFASNRDELLTYLNQIGIEAKVHYPKPIYLQPALAYLGHREGDFPNTDKISRESITFPCDQHLEPHQIQQVVEAIKDFYART